MYSLRKSYLTFLLYWGQNFTRSLGIMLFKPSPTSQPPHPPSITTQSLPTSDMPNPSQPMPVIASSSSPSCVTQNWPFTCRVYYFDTTEAVLLDTLEADKRNTRTCTHTQHPKSKSMPQTLLSTLMSYSPQTHLINTGIKWIMHIISYEHRKHLMSQEVQKL